MPKDACYHKVKARYRVFPSAYASGAIAKCRKVGAANYGKSSKRQKRKLLVALLRWQRVDLLLEVVVKLKIQGGNVLGLFDGCTQNKSWFSVKEMV